MLSGDELFRVYFKRFRYTVQVRYTEVYFAKFHSADLRCVNLALIAKASIEIFLESSISLIFSPTDFITSLSL